MTDAELDRLADLIAAELRRIQTRRPPSGTGRESWLPERARPADQPRTSEPPVWSAAAQSLGDVAPIRRPSPSAFRADQAAGAAAVSAAAASTASTNLRLTREASQAGPRTTPVSTRRRRSLPIDVKLGVSRRHLHLSAAHWAALFGSAPITSRRALLQPAQFASNESVAVVGPEGRLELLRVVGPTRGATQLELARSDAAVLGIDPPLAASGTLAKSLGGVTLVGPHGRVELARGVIVAARHLHLAPDDARQWGFRDGDRLDIRCGDGARAVTWHDVLIRSGPAHATEFHLDEDEARAADVSHGSVAQIVAWREGGQARRALVTERDVVALARRGEALPANALLTPSARDRARALGLKVE